MDNPEKTLAHLSQVEACAEEILRNRCEVVALDKRRQKDREGLRSLTKIQKRMSWISVGPTLIQLPTQKCRDLLASDQRMADIEINKCRSELKAQVNRLRDLEREDPVPGLSLIPLDNDEMSAVGRVLGKHV